MKIIFLDVDGVLTYSAYRNKDTSDIDIEKVKLLKKICDETDARVVISSSWKGNNCYIPKNYNLLLKILEENGIVVLGKTKYIKIKFNEDIKRNFAFSPEDIAKIGIKFGTGRAAEIQKWINEHHPENFVILDDEDYDWAEYGLDENWVQPTWYENGGLKSEHVETAIKILNK